MTDGMMATSFSGDSRLEIERRRDCYPNGRERGRATGIFELKLMRTADEHDMTQLKSKHGINFGKIPQSCGDNTVVAFAG